MLLTRQILIKILFQSRSRRNRIRDSRDDNMEMKNLVEKSRNDLQFAMHFVHKNCRL